jgi:hypothetical protein
MSKKDSLIKEIDEISERVRFWHNAILTLLTGVGGMMFAITQEKVIINTFIWIFVIMATLLLIVAVFRLEKLGNIRRELIKKLEKEN